MLEIYRTNNLIEVVRMARIPGSFLRTRFFPTTPRDIFKTPEVYIERTDEGNLCAPFVIPYSGAKLMEREGYTGEKLMPAFVNPARDMSIAQLQKKGIGETLYDEVTPEERAKKYLADDLVFLQKAIQRTQEWMCGQILVNGYVDCAINANDKVRFQYYDSSFGNLMTFLDGSNNPEYWDGSGVSIYEQLSAMVNDIDAEYGDIDIVLGAELVSVFLTDTQMLKMLDVANANFGRIDPSVEQIPGVGFLGAINFGGKLCNVYTYNAKAKINGSEVSFISPKYALAIPRTGFGATKFGSITQMEDDDEYHTYAAEMVPRILAEKKNDQKRIEMKSAPLPHPYALDSWRVVKALA